MKVFYSREVKRPGVTEKTEFGLATDSDGDSFKQKRTILALHTYLFWGGSIPLAYKILYEILFS